MLYTNCPADLDTVSALTRAFGEAFPGEALCGSTSDFKSAYRQATANPDHFRYSMVTMWDPVRKQPCFAYAAAQLFGNSAASLNFCRIPDWCCFVGGALFRTAFVHCIDDLIFFERSSEAPTAYHCWRSLADAYGWNIPDDKSPPPTRLFGALGAMIDLRALPSGAAVISIAKDRVDKMTTIFNSILESRTLGPALAGQIFGQLGFACSQFHGRWGRAKLHPFVRRQHEPKRFGLNKQLESALQWWLCNLAYAPPREVFVSSGTRHIVVTYSDGEGADAAVCVAAWCYPRIGSVPWAGYLEVPREVRELWSQQKRHAAESVELGEEFRDIIEIVGVGLLVMLHSWPELFRDSLWIHFIDNNSALGGLVKGSASVRQQDLIIGHTWSLIVQLNVLVWFDRVDSASNPVDGLSRGDFSGDWNWQHVAIPDFIQTLRAFRRPY